MLTSNDIQLGQTVEAGIWFRCGYQGDDKDYALIIGTVIRKMECYNQILVDVNAKKSFNAPKRSIWVEMDKSEVQIIN